MVAKYRCLLIRSVQDLNKNRYASKIDCYVSELEARGLDVTVQCYNSSTGGAPLYGTSESLVMFFRTSFRLIRRILKPRLNIVFIFDYFVWRYYISKSRVDLVLAIEPSQSFIKACNTEKVCLVECQHGVVTAKNFMNRDVFPRFFIVWDTASKETLQERLRGPIYCYVSGLKKTLHADSDTRSSFMLWLESVSEIRLLFTLQWGLKDVHYYSELELKDCFLPSFVIECLKGARHRVKPLFRLHPMSRHRGEDLKIINSLLREGLVDSPEEVFAASDCDLSLLLTFIDVHATLYSSAVIESVGLGVRSLVLDPACNGGFRNDFFSKYLHTGLISYCNDFEFSAFLASLDRMDHTRSGTENASSETNWMDNLLEDCFSDKTTCFDSNK